MGKTPMYLYILKPDRPGLNPLWKQAGLIMVATMIVDLDHLLANPVYDPNRCSINFHPLHSYTAIFLYIILTAFPKSRLIGLGLLLHMGIDLTDCI